MTTYTITEFMNLDDFSITDNDLMAILASHNCGNNYHMFQRGCYVGSMYSYYDAKSWVNDQHENNPDIGTIVWASVSNLDGVQFYAHTTA